MHSPATDNHPLSALPIRATPDLPALIADMKAALQRAGQMDFLERMEQNHYFRHCQWENQDWSGRKLLREGVSPDKIFPWPGASDARIPLVDEIINENGDQLITAYDMGRTRVGPRDLSTDEARQNLSVLWSGVSDYYSDQCALRRRTAVAQWVDYAEEFGHSMLFLGWAIEQRTEKRTITSEDLLRMLTVAALQQAEGMAAAAAQETGAQPDPESGQFLTEEEAASVATAVQTGFTTVLADPDLQPALVQQLQTYDPDMPASEARRVATSLRAGEAATYYAPYTWKNHPDSRALRPFLDVFYPLGHRYAQQLPWICLPEWVTAAELTERIDSKGYDPAVTEEIIANHKGRAWDFSRMTGLKEGVQGWLISGGCIGATVAAMPNEDQQSSLYQILHVYWRATALGDVPAVYHTTFHPGHEASALAHLPCEHQHGAYPFQERVRENAAPSMDYSRGVGEVSFSYQNGIKVQIDMQTDNASMQLMPPAEVPARMAGGRNKLVPRGQIPRITTGGVGGINWLKPPGDTRSSEKIQADLLDLLNNYWARGPKVDPDVKLTRRRRRVKDFLTELSEAEKLTFALIQQYSPEEIRAASVAGLPVDLDVTRAEIQGGISLDVSFDPADLDMDTVLKKLKILNEGLLPLDRTGSLNTHNILRAAVSALLPGWVREIMPNTPEAVLQSEIADEDRILTALLAGQEQPYIPGKDHRARLNLLRQRLSATNEDGTPTKIQRTMQQEPDVAGLIENRAKFHQFQLDQQNNANVGRMGVEPQQQAPQAQLPAA